MAQWSEFTFSMPISATPSWPQVARPVQSTQSNSSHNSSTNAQWAGPTPFSMTTSGITKTHHRRRASRPSIDLPLARIESRLGRRFTLLEWQLMQEVDSMRESMMESNTLMMNHVRRLEDMIHQQAMSTNSLTALDARAARTSSVALSHESLRQHDSLIMSQADAVVSLKPIRQFVIGSDDETDDDKETQYTCSLCLSHSAREHSVEDDDQSSSIDIPCNYSNFDTNDDSFLLVSSPDMEDLDGLDGSWSDAGSDKVVYTVTSEPGWRTDWIQNSADWRQNALGLEVGVNGDIDGEAKDRERRGEARDAFWYKFYGIDPKPRELKEEIEEQ